MASWSNQPGDQFDHDMEPNGNYKLKVDIDRACNAIEAANSNANGQALKVTEGETEILDQTVISKNIDDNTLLITNTNTDEDARALKVEGMAEIAANSAGFPAPESTGLSVSNSSTNPSARALKVQAPFEGDDPATIAMEVVNNSAHQSARAVKITGRTEINAINGEDDPNTTGLHVINRSDHNNAKALRIEGRTNIAASMGGDPSLTVVNAHADEDSRAMVVQGSSFPRGSMGTK